MAILAEPPRSQYDLNFSVAGIPVRVHPYFWLVSLVLGASGDPEPVGVVIWVAAVFVSILVHEMGHALMIRYFGWQPWITLYGLGGLASHRPTYRDPLKQIAISFCGPLAGFALAVAVAGGVVAGGRTIIFMGLILGSGEVILQPYLLFLVNDLLFINIFWGLLNLMPVFPLDGGQIARDGLQLLDPIRGDERAFLLSTFTAAVLGVLALVQFGAIFIALFFGFMAYQSYQAYRQCGRGPYW